ncbi:aerolysin-4-like [Physella acuta]|uniref:aerolysin-4-like n=1 Tax=Physella acuta TaxID=109671 RepID=UPI0027DD3366|nr:aerolysin-4-like [Physella acuta]
MSLAHVVVLMALVDTGGAGCSRTNWTESWKKAGNSRCNGYYDFISGFYRAAFTGAESDSIELIEGVECCSRNLPWDKSRTQVMIANWWYSFHRDDSWSLCPTGYFLNGFYRTKDADRGFLDNIKVGRCSKPSDHPAYYSHCYDHDIGTCFANVGLCKCNDGYYVTGLYKGNCSRLYCIRTLRCCKPASAPEVLDELYMVQTRIMDNTMYDIANFSDVIGYDWCGGCRAQFTGEDFVREGDTWISNVDQPCRGDNNNKRLSMAYGDWSFAMKDIKYGPHIIQNLVPETIDSGTFYNNHVTEAMKTIIRSESSVRTVTHTTTSSWKSNLDLNIQVTYKPPGVGISAGYKFGYETSTSTKNEKSEKTSKSFTMTTSKNIKAYSAAKWSFIVAKTRTSITYTATIIARFSTELQGILRGGGGKHDIDTNYHNKYHGSDSVSKVNYKFGSSSVPFYTDLKQQSDTSSHPWLWNDMRDAYPEFQQMLNDLCDENRYVFQLTGRFDDVVGTSGDFTWEAVPLSKRSADRYKRVPDRIFQNSTHVARALPNDDPPIKFDPP